MNASDFLDRARKALRTRDGISKPSSTQLAEADVYARIAQATALDRMAAALEALAADAAPAPGTVQPAIHHSA
ncbi:hypothetical protein ACGFNY_45415 [Streptomyces chartreusis]|uniref:hypothetical protein n=1 Tax=Streptomyces chartreusis TaxID=1969 RepID=UPI003723D298